MTWRPGSRSVGIPDPDMQMMRGEWAQAPRLSESEVDLSRNIAKEMDEYCKRYASEPRPPWCGTCSVWNMDPFAHHDYHVPDESELERMDREYRSAMAGCGGRFNDKTLETVVDLTREDNRFALRELAEFYINTGNSGLARSYLLYAIMCGDTDSAIRNITDRRLSPYSDPECWSELSYAVGPAIAVCPGFLEKAERLASEDPYAAGIVAEWMRRQDGYEDAYTRFLEYGLKDTSSRASILRADDICYGGCPLTEISERDVRCLEYSSDHGSSSSSIMLGRMSFIGISVERSIEDAIYYFAKACIQKGSWLPRAWMAYLAYPETGVARGHESGCNTSVPECTVLDDLIKHGAGYGDSDGYVYEDDLFIYHRKPERSTVSVLHFKPLGMDVIWSRYGLIPLSDELSTSDIRWILRNCIDDVVDAILDLEHEGWQRYEDVDVRCSPCSGDGSTYDNLADYREVHHSRDFFEYFMESGLSLEYDTTPLSMRDPHDSRGCMHRRRREPETLGARVRRWFGRLTSRS